ncbi:V-type H+-transporting ATPase subunit E [Nematocida minor]|uniref:V-type H+-transporting ATPase subunit E n=1 Tax=Nematocida minor TaxID=1912983 RepID=UPI00221FA095|nr:V-type H+-transporting ATPase subunit E [Nematocida minor]KAI5192689.1 V-type H+-transporting ATPase subunit E [Nematocida minor]
MTGKPLTTDHGNRKYAVDGWDMGRMLKFIEQESEQKANEIKIKANEKYAIEVAEMAVKSMKKINQQKTEEIHKIKSEKTIAEGKLRSKASITIAREKEQIINKILNKTIEKCQDQPLTTKLAQDAIGKYRFIFPCGKMIIYVRNQDRKVVESLLSPEEYTIEEMQENLLGGIVIRNEERTVLVNNSYLERIRCAGEKIQPVIQKVLFTKLDQNE